MPGHTIDAALKLHNRYDLNDQEIAWLREQFNVINKNSIPRPGDNMKIPLLLSDNDK